MRVPDEGSSRNVSYVLKYISTFLLYNIMTLCYFYFHILTNYKCTC